jgi:hypothetical protein
MTEWPDECAKQKGAPEALSALLYAGGTYGHDAHEWFRCLRVRHAHRHVLWEACAENEARTR